MKIKSSALLITLALGIVLSGIIIGVAATYSQFVKSSAQAREGKKSYRAALSGIEDGLLRYKYYLAGTQNPADLYDLPDDPISLNADVSYRLSFKMDSITYGNAEFPAGFKIGTTSSTADIASRQAAIRQNVDDVIDIDLSYFTYLPEEEQPESLTIHFTPPCDPAYCTAATYRPLSGYFTAMNYRLVDVKATNEDQMIYEETVNSSSLTSIAVHVNSLVVECRKTSRNCHLRITPRVAKNSLVGAGRLEGMGVASQGKRVFLAIEARTSGDQNPLIPSTGKRPGTITITSVGVARGAERKLEARVDSSSGRYIGLFDYGIYCGAECIGI
ncbi:MAG: hypothetical protein OEV37_02055 [Candidatus Berkelbacteria bacterium]|nr:hypothetical protein [Candidatus Berkelbacteria bacterium]